MPVLMYESETVVRREKENLGLELYFRSTLGIRRLDTMSNAR